MNIQKLSEKDAKSLLKHIISKLDELDCEDYFGSEGWKHFFEIDEDEY